MSKNTDSSIKLLVLYDILLVLPETLTEIGNYAFSGCVGLTGIIIPNTVTNIGQSAFSGCAGITKLTLPNGLQAIGQEAFKNMQLQSIVVPSSVTSIGVGAFQGCPFESITLPFVGKSRTASAYEAVFGYIFGYATTEATDSSYGYSYPNISTEFTDKKYSSVSGAVWQYSCHNNRYSSSSCLFLKHTYIATFLRH